MTREASASSTPRRGASDVVPLEVRRRLQQCYEAARRALAQPRPDHDHAHRMFAECVVGDPGNLLYVNALLANLRHKYQDNKRGTLFGVFASRGAFRRAVLRQDWSEVLRLGPDALRNNPWDRDTLAALARAAGEQDAPEVEWAYLQMALEATPDDTPLLRQCAETLTRRGRFEEAAEFWQRVAAADPRDADAAAMVRQLAPTASRPAEAAVEAAAEFVPVADDSAAGTIPVTPQQRLERLIVEDPTHLDHYLQLARLYAAEERFAAAERVLQRALAASPGEILVQERLEDLTIERMRRQVAVAEQRHAAAPSDETARLADQLRETFNRYELEVYAARSQRYPGDTELRFELGRRLKRVRKFREALECFEACRAAPRRGPLATLESGECWQHLRQFAKALECYLEAAERAKSDDLAEEEKLARYRAGVLAAGLREVPLARLQFQRVLRLEPGFRDAQARLDKLAAIGDKD